jgi:Zn-dependent protease with chaperone function
MSEDLYPPNSTGLPPNLTVPNARYRRSVVIVLISLILFLLLYLSLIVASGWLLYQGIIYDMGEVNRGSTGLKIAMIVLPALLFLFLVKGLFKRGKRESEMRIEIKETEQPELFAFVRRLCQDTRAPFPYRIYLSPEVNAAVFYNSSLLNLIFPVRKNLLIGMGLINALTLSEFKAVLAHEFGHFAQSSMRLGSYVYMSNRIIADMVFTRDAFDEFLAQWRRVDLRLAIFGHLFYFVVWVLRMILAGAFRLINFVESALSRQMEFHADLVAVSVTGSDALIHALARLDFANTCLMQSLQDLKDAADHRIYSRDLYYHQNRAADYLRAIQNQAELGTLPALPADPGEKTRVFQPGDEGIPSMWASHPSNYDREENAKQHYVRSIEDARSPWLLFRDPDAIRETMTQMIYHEVMELPQQTYFSPAETVQAFIDEEHAETRQDPRYQGMYDGRFVEPGDLNALAAALRTSPWPEERIQEVATRLYNGEFKDWLEQHTERQGESQLLEGLQSGELKPKHKTFPIRGVDVSLSDVKGLIERVDRELEADKEWLDRFDAEVFQAHLGMAQQCEGREEKENDLLARYEFHRIVQEVLRQMNIQQATVENLFAFLNNNQGKISEGDMRSAVACLREARAAIEQSLQKTWSAKIPALHNILPHQTLGPFLLNEPIVADLSPLSDSIQGEWVQAMMKQLIQIQEKARRMHFKSLGAILAHQEAISAEWQRRREEGTLLPSEPMQEALSPQAITSPPSDYDLPGL